MLAYLLWFTLLPEYSENQYSIIEVISILKNKIIDA